MDTKKAYRDFLLSPAWFRQREKAIAFHGGCCMKCGSKDRIEVHHKHYGKPWGQEDVERDLEVLCHKCHISHHVQNAPAIKVTTKSGWQKDMLRRLGKGKRNSSKRKRWLRMKAIISAKALNELPSSNYGKPKRWIRYSSHLPLLPP